MTLGRPRAPQRLGAQLVNTLADASPLNTAVQTSTAVQTRSGNHQLCKAKGRSSKVALMCQNFAALWPR